MGQKIVIGLSQPVYPSVVQFRSSRFRVRRKKLVEVMARKVNGSRALAPDAQCAGLRLPRGDSALGPLYCRANKSSEEKLPEGIIKYGVSRSHVRAVSVEPGRWGWTEASARCPSGAEPSRAECACAEDRETARAYSRARVRAGSSEKCTPAK